jgi:hypothetical protein
MGEGEMICDPAAFETGTMISVEGTKREGTVMVARMTRSE